MSGVANLLTSRTFQVKPNISPNIHMGLTDGVLLRAVHADQDRIATNVHCLRNTTMSSTSSDLSFTPCARDMLIIESFNSMCGSGVSSAFIQHPSTPVGFLLNHRGIATVPPEKWAVLLQCVKDAIQIIKQEGGMSWSRPQYESCPTDYFYDLGPVETQEEFAKFQLTGHEVYGDEPWTILHYATGQPPVVVSEIPAPLVKLEETISGLAQELIPGAVASEEADRLLNAVDKMATSGSDAFWS
ncbi:hypothetical protein C8R44DRAFT_877511 [Mycena epipterygia]|nr:hypothetical protein C8R44DRAFT_877511 [Mycena epipterygia]